MKNVLSHALYKRSMKPKNHRSDYFFSFFLSLKESPTFRPLILVAFSQNFRFCFFPFFLSLRPKKKNVKLKEAAWKFFGLFPTEPSTRFRPQRIFLGAAQRPPRSAAVKQVQSLSTPFIGQRSVHAATQSKQLSRSRSPQPFTSFSQITGNNISPLEGKMPAEIWFLTNTRNNERISSKAIGGAVTWP